MEKGMNRIERSFAVGQEAKVRYLDGEFQVLKNGAFVRCAVTGEPIRLEDLRYWSVAYQEPYLNAEVSLKRNLERMQGQAS
jgi:hypothetical protein